MQFTDVSYKKTRTWGKIHNAFPKRGSKYMGSVIQGNGEIDEDYHSSYWGRVDEIIAFGMSSKI